MKLYYLGPQGSFTFQAAQDVAHIIPTQVASLAGQQFELQSCAREQEIFEHVEEGEGCGIVAWENNVEGYVAVNLDRLIDAHNVAAVFRHSIDVEFDAFVRADHGELTEVTAHPHGLAQCMQFMERNGLRAVSASSNSAALESLQPHQVGLAPRHSGELFGLNTFARSVQDFTGAHTDFLVLAPRGYAVDACTAWKNAHVACESIITVIPLSTGPGVIADLLDVFRDNGINMTSLISRPIKAVDGTYSFIITLDAAPWDSQAQRVLQEIQDHNDWLKILAVYPQRNTVQIPATQWNLPHLGLNPMLEEDKK
ncbi:prephenate dehydratase [Alloscardovia criceti]|uniref:prephenate dehydratase n=1 Tax=Alloscardovia criceti TaxID=356828 RepID=UPI00036A37AD|nr:prephenate dehydratase domain-containing protein [Alloscardovia criceti]